MSTRNKSLPPRGRCKTCHHTDRARIEVALANGVDISRIEKQFPGTSYWSVWRHWRDHVTEARKTSLRVVGASDIKVDLDALKRLESESLLQNLINERARLQRIADACEHVCNFADATRASAGIVRVLELTAKFLGELKTGNTTITQNFLLSPDWVQLRQVIAAALRPYPDAQRAVLAAVREHETSRGAEVTYARVIDHKPVEREVTADA